MHNKLLIPRIGLVMLLMPLLGLLTSDNAEGKTIILKRNFVDGRTFYIEKTDTRNVKITGMPMFDKDEKVTEILGAWSRTTKNSDGTITVKVTFDRAARKIESEEGLMEFDTDNPNNEEAAPQIGAILQPMIGESITMTYNDANELTSFSGMEALRDKITKAVGWSMHWEQMKDEFNDEQGKIQWGELPLAALPNRNAVVGDTWDKSYSFDAGHMGTIITDHHFTVSDIKTQQDRPIVEIASKVKLHTAENAPKPAEGEQGPTPPTINGTFTGSSVFDAVRGMIVKAQAQGHTVITMVPFPGAGTMKIDINSQNTIIVTDKKKDKSGKQAG